mgnify:CR=1 FL=1
MYKSYDWNYKGKTGKGLDLQADGGTHVHNTREVGKIKITNYKSKGGINKRIYVEIED